MEVWSWLQEGHLLLTTAACRTARMIKYRDGRQSFVVQSTYHQHFKRKLNYNYYTKTTWQNSNKIWRGSDRFCGSGCHRSVNDWMRPAAILQLNLACGNAFVRTLNKVTTWKHTARICLPWRATSIVFVLDAAYCIIGLISVSCHWLTFRHLRVTSSLST